MHQATLDVTVADIVATVRFYADDEGGRQKLTPPDKFGCLLELDGEYFDCRLLLSGIGAVWPGRRVFVPIKFLLPQLILPRLKPGVRFHLREAETIAEGVVEQML